MDSKSTKSTRARVARDNRPAHADDAEVLKGVAAELGDMMDHLVIYAAALKASACDVARTVGKQLDADMLSNDLDVQREIVEEVAERLRGAP